MDDEKGYAETHLHPPPIVGGSNGLPIGLPRPADGSQEPGPDDGERGPALRDEVTGLANRIRFEDLLGQALARSRRAGTGVAVLTVNIDRFQLVNDSLGHAAGDLLLERFGAVLTQATRETDLVARLGGDIFLVMLGDLERHGEAGESASVAEAVAARIHDALATPLDLDGTELYATAGIGISLYPDDADDPRTLLRHASTATGAAKRLGPGETMVFAPGGSDTAGRLSLVTRLRKAIEDEHWTLHYQPIVDLPSGRMLGVEALVRWEDPEHGQIPPGEFIPLAEDMGWIVQIGEWVVQELGRQGMAWRDAGLELDIGFNLSPRQLRNRDAVDRILALIKDGGFDPSRVLVEITESIAVTDPEATIDTLRAIHAEGIRLALDDFGSGYSSLARLKEMPVDFLKIDRSMIRGIGEDPAAGSLVSAIMALAASLGMTALAEGIETPAQRRFLEDRGCRLGQGFLFSKPVTGDEILALHTAGGILGSEREDEPGETEFGVRESGAAEPSGDASASSARSGVPAPSRSR